MMRAVRAADVVSAARRGLGLAVDPTDAQGVDDAFLAASLRRLAGFLSPCPPGVLVSELVESLCRLSHVDEAELMQRVEDVLELLVAGGDLLELGQVATGGDLPGTTLFAAPPGFVALEGGAVVLIGLSPDEPTPLPGLLQGKATHRGTLREIAADPALDIALALANAGWRRISRAAWLRSPPRQSPVAHVHAIDTKLSVAPQGGLAEEMRLLDPERPSRFYRGRWTRPISHTGCFVCRRPQAYGADLWCYAEFRAGKVLKLLGFPLPGSRFRGCDEAWRLQLALDSVRGAPQAYRVCPTADGFVAFEFFAPLPAWGQRHLALNGRTMERGEGALFAWKVRSTAAADLENFLQEDLWLVQAGQKG